MVTMTHSHYDRSRSLLFYFGRENHRVFESFLQTSLGTENVKHSINGRHEYIVIGLHQSQV